MSDDVTPAIEQTVHGLLLCRDLMFTSKVTGTAAALGLRIETVGSVEGMQSRAGQTRPGAIFLDLNCPDFQPQDVINALAGLPRPQIIAFGSHVDVDRLESARVAGCDLVLPRSKFSSTLPDLLRQTYQIS
jgi:CheY-like chemotaxis protein